MNRIVLTFLSLRFHQRQLLEETQGGSPSPPRPTQLDVEKHSPLHTVPQGGAREVKKIPAASPAAALSDQETGKRAALSLYYYYLKCSALMIKTIRVNISIDSKNIVECSQCSAFLIIALCVCLLLPPFLQSL